MISRFDQKNDKHLLVPTSQMWGFSVFVCLHHCKMKFFSWLSKTSILKISTRSLGCCRWAFFFIFIQHLRDSQQIYKETDSLTVKQSLVCSPSASASLYASAHSAAYGVSVFSETCCHRSASLACHGYMWQAISGALWLNKQPSEARCGLGRLQLHSSPHQAKKCPI